MANIPISASFAGAGALNITWYLIYVKSIHYPANIQISANFAGEGSLQVVIPESDVNIYMTTDPVNRGIYSAAGSDVLYRAASGLEKAMADVDAGRLIATYAELVRDQWDPWAISYRNLGFLAWAMGVNLWEDDWAEDKRRQWVANQWTFKYYRGSDLGLKMAVEAVNAKIKNIVRPPALFMPGSQVGDAQAALQFLVPNAQYQEGIVGDAPVVGNKQWYNNLIWLDKRPQPSWNDIVNADRQLYVRRFPQLRLYPFAPRPQLPWLNYLGGKSYDKQGNPIPVHNGYFFGPARLFFPTNFNAGGRYLRSCTLYDPATGVETQLTVRTVTGVPLPGMPITTWDEIQLPINSGNLFYPGEDNKRYLFPRGVSLTIKRKHSVVLGRLPFEDRRLVRVPRDGTLNITQFQAIFQTIAPSLKPIDVRPEMVSVIHPMRPTEFYCGQPLHKKFLPKSNSWQYIYERWYLFDPTRQPDARWARTYMGRARFGIPKYTAKVKIDAPFPWPPAYAYAGGHIGKGRYFAPKNTKRIDQVRRAVTSAMALRDTVQIDTKVKRMIRFADITLLDGTFSFGQYITDSW
jgi:phage tail P2-like protein